MKIQVEVNKGDGNVAILSYEAPDDSKVGDVGTVPMFVRGLMQEVTYPAKIVSLQTAYDGPCKTFTPTTTDGPADTADSRECPACGMAMGPYDTHWSIFPEPMGGYVCPSEDDEPEVPSGGPD